MAEINSMEMMQNKVDAYVSSQGFNDPTIQINHEEGTLILFKKKDKAASNTYYFNPYTNKWGFNNWDEGFNGDAIYEHIMKEISGYRSVFYPSPSAPRSIGKKETNPIIESIARGIGATILLMFTISGVIGTLEAIGSIFNLAMGKAPIIQASGTNDVGFPEMIAMVIIYPIFAWNCPKWGNRLIKKSPQKKVAYITTSILCILMILRMC